MILRPKLLQHPTIPKALQGINPRTIMGPMDWEDVRYETINKQDDKCLACGHKEKLECHEVYNINYLTGEVKFVEFVGLCVKCHRFIHSGLLRSLYLTGKITEKFYEETMTYGLITLANAGLEPHVMTLTQWLYYAGNISDGEIGIHYNNDQVAQLFELRECKIKWDEWYLLYKDKKYYSKFKSMKEWELYYRRKQWLNHLNH